LATVSTEYKRLFLRGLKWSAEEEGISLYAALKAAARGRLSQTANGKVILATTGNGQSVTFSIPNEHSAFTPQAAAELCEELLTRFEAAVTATGTSAAASLDGSNDAALLTEMLALLEPITEVHSDFSELRCHA
jgi:hypothetical protein